MTQIARWFTALTLTLLLAGCGVVPITGRQQLNLVSDAEISAASAQQYNQFIRKANVDNNSPQGQQTLRVAQRIAQATDNYLRNNGYDQIAQATQWEFNFVRDRQVNAFCMPGGKIVVYSGLLQATRPTDDELAAVIAHEVSHAVAKHANERISREMLTQLSGQVLTGMVGSKSAALGGILQQVYPIGSQLLVSLPYGRKQEYEADKIGMVFMAMAGYDPAAAVTLWQKMAQQGKKTPEFLSTHPSDENRIRAIQEFLPEARQYYSGPGVMSQGPKRSIKSLDKNMRQERRQTSSQLRDSGSSSSAKQQDGGGFHYEPVSR